MPASSPAGLAFAPQQGRASGEERNVALEGKPGNVMKKPRSVTLNPKNKEVIVSDMRLNAVLTCYFPEIF